MKKIRVHVVHYKDCRNLVMRYKDPDSGKWKRQTVYRDPQTGEETETTDNRKFARKLAARWEADLNEGRAAGRDNAGWDVFRQRYEEEVLPGMADSTGNKWATVANAVERILPKMIGGRLSELTAESLSRLTATLRDGKLSENTIASYLAHLRAALQWAVDMKMLRAVPTIKRPQRAKRRGSTTKAKGRAVKPREFETMLLKVPEALVVLKERKRDAAKAWIIRNQFGRRNLTAYQRGELALALEPLIRKKAKEKERERKTTLQKSAKSSENPIDTRKELAREANVSHDTIEKVRKIAAVAPAPIAVDPEAVESWQHYLRGLWLSGLRLEESLNLYWDRRDRLHVDLSGKRPMLAIPAECEKGNQDRRLPITPDFAEFLMETPEEEREGPVFLPLLATGRASYDQAGRIISLIGELADIEVHKHPRTGKVKYASAHDLRRAFGERWAKKVMPAVLQKFMRHESIQTTMAYYVDLDSDALADEVWEKYEASKPRTDSGTVAPDRPRRAVRTEAAAASEVLKPQAV